VRVLIAADASWVIDEVVAALGGPDTSFTVCRDGRTVAPLIAERAAAGEGPDLVVTDLQIGSMGGMAVVMDLRLDETSGRIPHVPVIVLLDRLADVHLARRCGAEGWLVKPIESLRLRRAARAVLAGTTWQEGVDTGTPDTGAAGAEQVTTG
jgi:CheY-like chemotaxis protein